MICGYGVEQLLLNIILEWLHLGVHRTCRVARSRKVCLLLDAADVLENFDFLLHAFYLFNLLCSILRRDMLLAYVRSPGEMARILRGTAPSLSSSHYYDPDSAVVLGCLDKQLTPVA